MSFPLGANTEFLRREEFQAFINHMRNAYEALKNRTGPLHLPPPRADIDRVVNQVVPQSWEALLAVAEGFTKLPGLDADQLQELAALIEAMEAANTDTATTAFDRPTGPIIV